MCGVLFVAARGAQPQEFPQDPSSWFVAVVFVCFYMLSFLKVLGDLLVCILRVWVSHLYIGVSCACNALRGQNKVLDPMELELQTVVSSYVVAGDRSEVLWKSSQCS